MIHFFPVIFVQPKNGIKYIVKEKGECEKAVFHGWSNFPVVISDILRRFSLSLSVSFCFLSAVCVFIVVCFECCTPTTHKCGKGDLF